METKNEQITATSKKFYKKWWGILLILLGVFIVLFSVFFIVYTIILSKDIKSLSEEELLLRQLQSQTKYIAESSKKDNNFFYGSEKAKITIVEFGDFFCLSCKSSFTKIREIGLKYEENVKIIYRDYPQYEGSLDLAMAARCAGEQGAFWEMHDKLFLNQGEETLLSLTRFAAQIDLDIEIFEECLEDQRHLQEIENDVKDAQRLMVEGTPTWFVNGYKIEGDMPYEMWVKIIEGLIKKL